MHCNFDKPCWSLNSMLIIRHWSSLEFAMKRMWVVKVILFWHWILMEKIGWTKKCWMGWAVFCCTVCRQMSGMKFTGYAIQLEINSWLGMQIRVPFGKKKSIRFLNISENMELIGANCSRYLSSGFYRCGRYFINLGLLVPPTA